MNDRLEEITEMDLMHMVQWSAIWRNSPYPALKRAGKIIQRLISALESARAEIKLLGRQLDNIMDREASVCPDDVGCDEYIPKLEADRDRWKGLAEVADERVRELVGALKPFADAATVVDLDAGNDWCIWGPQNNKKELPQIIVGHLRQAAVILRKHGKE